MIFVTVGMSEYPFDRLLRSFDRPLPWSVVAQTGASTERPLGARCYDFLSIQCFRACMRRAELVVSHAGVGAVLLGLLHDTPLVVVPRRKEFGEIVDDHQILFAERLRELGLVTVADDLTDLRETLCDVRGARINLQKVDPLGLLGNELNGYLQQRLRDPGPDLASRLQRSYWKLLLARCTAR